MENVREITVWWDTQDKANEGWAYRVCGVGDDRDEGPYDGVLAGNADGSALQNAVVSLAFQFGVTITNDDVVVEPNIDGGYAKWTADEETYYDATGEDGVTIEATS